MYVYVYVQINVYMYAVSVEVKGQFSRISYLLYLWISGIKPALAVIPWRLLVSPGTYCCH